MQIAKLSKHILLGINFREMHTTFCCKECKGMQLSAGNATFAKWEFRKLVYAETRSGRKLNIHNTFGRRRGRNR